MSLSPARAKQLRRGVHKEVDKRVQAIRCRSCHRLRQHPRTDDFRTWSCGCGSLQFFASFPHPDEEQIALKLYHREIEEANLYTRLGQEIIADWRHRLAEPEDKPEPKIIIAYR